MVTYDPVTRDWAELVTAGQVPAPTAGAASAVSSEGTLYVYGGVARGDRHGFWLVDTSTTHIVIPSSQVRLRGNI